MKICNLYGDGFYFIPGTDICLKLGGYVRNQHYYRQGIQPGFGPMQGQAQVQQTRLAGASNDYVMRTRAIATIDTRQQTEYGTLRTYFLIGFTHENGSGALATAGGTAVALYATRGFIQFAGFTLGKATSFFDFYSIASVSYLVTHGSDTGDGGQNVAAYTANFGNGFTSTVSLEDPRRLNVVNTGVANAFVVGNNPTASNAGIRYPDVVANLRVDQAWGGAMIGAVLHDASGAYYGTTLTGAAVNGHPPDKVGYAATVGLRVNTPWIATGDFFQMQAIYGEGTGKYVTNTPPTGGSAAWFGTGNSLGAGWWSDGVFGTGTDLELTKAWGVIGAFEHRWTPQFRTSLYASYIDFSFTDGAKALICSNVSGGAGTLSALSNCDPDFQVLHVGSRTQYNFTPDFYAGFEVQWQRLYTAHKGLATFTAAANLPRPTGQYAIEDQDNVSATIRFHRDFRP